MPVFNDHGRPFFSVRTVRACCYALCLALCFAVTQAAATAHERDFPTTYDWFQASQGEREIEVHSIYSQQDRAFEHQLEFEYGVSNRFMVAPYLVYAQNEHQHAHFDAFKLETRYQLGDFQQSHFLYGLYAEYEKPRDEVSELEAKLIVSRYDRVGGDLSLNFVSEKRLATGSNLRTAVTAGYARSLPHTRVRLGGELYKSIDNGQINGGPTLAFAPTRGLWAVTSYGFAINNAKENKPRVDLLVEWEF